MTEKDFLSRRGPPRAAQTSLRSKTREAHPRGLKLCGKTGEPSTVQVICLCIPRPDTSQEPLPSQFHTRCPESATGAAASFRNIRQTSDYRHSSAFRPRFQLNHGVTLLVLLHHYLPSSPWNGMMVSPQRRSTPWLDAASRHRVSSSFSGS